MPEMTCCACGGPARWLCDFDTGDGRTCDRPMCDLHRVNKASGIACSRGRGRHGKGCCRPFTIDHCPGHAGAQETTPMSSPTVTTTRPRAREAPAAPATNEIVPARQEPPRQAQAAPPPLERPGERPPGCPRLTAALAAARDRCGTAEKAARNAFHKYNYASADGVIQTAKEALAASGLALLPVGQELTTVQAGPHVIYALNRTVLLSHESGEFVALELRGWPVVDEKGRPPDKAFAIALTTSLAYLLRDLLCMPRAEADDDMAAREDRQTAAPQPAPAPPKQEKPAPAPDYRAGAQAAKRAGAPAHPDLHDPMTAEQEARLNELLALAKLGPDDLLLALEGRGLQSAAQLTVAVAGEMIASLEERLKAAG